MRALAITSLVDSIPAFRLFHLAQGVAQGVEYVLNSLCLVIMIRLPSFLSSQMRFNLLMITTNQPIMFLVTINTTDPIYYYCGQIGHCQAGMVGVINPPCNQGNSFTASGSFNAYKSLAMAVKEVGPLPSVIMGGQLVSTYPTGRPTGSQGPYYTGYSASCTAGVNSSSNSTESLTTSATTSSATSVGTSAASSGLQPLSSSEGESLYSSVLFRGKELPSLFWQAGSGFGLVIAVIFAFVIL
jgi:hypothetical protein